MKKINVFQTAFVLPYLTLISINLASAFKCGTDELKIEPLPISVPKEVQKRRAANEFTPIKIKADYTNVICFFWRIMITATQKRKMLNLANTIKNRFNTKLMHYNKGDIVHEKRGLVNNPSDYLINL